MAKMRVKLKSYAHQKQAIKFHLGRNYSMNASEAGTGKTRVAILTALSRMKYNNVNKVLIVCPKSLLWTWRDEIWKHGNRKSIVVTGDKAEKLRRLSLRGNLFIINYDSTIIKAIFQKIQDLNFDMGIWDESSYLKNSQSKRSQMNYIIGDDLTFKLMLTGTPITDSILDIYSQYKILDGGVTFGTNYYKFFRYLYRPVLQYMPGKTKYFLGGYWLQKVGAEKAIQHKLKGTIISFKKSQCLGLPDKIFIRRYAEWINSSEQFRDYIEVNKEIVQELVKWIKKDPLDISLDDILRINITTVLAKMNKLQQICSGFVYSSEKDRREYIYNTNPKLNALCEVLEEYLSSSKIVVFSQFIFDKKLIFSIPFKKYMTSDVDEFVNGSKRIFVSSQVSSGVGLNLQVANTMVYFNHHFGLEKFVQSQDRIHRIGQTEKCIYIHLLMKNSIDELIVERLEKKWKTAEAILNYLRQNSYK